MKFEVGDMVMHGWCPDKWVEVDRRMQIGELIEGPFTAAFSPLGEVSAWTVKWRDGAVLYSPESLLIKIPPEELQDKEEHEKTDESSVETA